MRLMRFTIRGLKMAKMNEFPVARLHEILHVNSDTGLMFWKHRPEYSSQWNGKMAGKQAFITLGANGYLYGAINGVKYLAHRVLRAMSHMEWPSEGLDHINGDTIDNRLSNLRIACKSKNGMNRDRQSNNSSGVKGVHYDKSRGLWVAQIKYAGRRKFIGRYGRLCDASAAYEDASIKYHGEFSNISSRNLEVNL